MDIELYNDKDVQAIGSKHWMKLDITLYNFLPTSLDRGSTEYLLYVITVLNVDLCLYSFKIMSS